MGWTGPVVGDVEHEGWVVPLFADGVESAGASSSRGILVDFDRDEWRPDDEVTGWRAGCECGWRGSIWTRHRGEWTGGPIDELRHLIHHEDRFADLDEEAEGVVIAEWRSHIRPFTVLEDVSELAKRHGEVGRQLDAAVSAARSGGASWADIGRAVGITRQSAHERWATLV